MSERVSGFGSNSPNLLPREMVNLWLTRLRLETEASLPDDEKFGVYNYLEVVHLINSELIENRLPWMGVNLDEVITRLNLGVDPEEQVVVDGVLRFGASAAARRCLNTDPSYVQAQIIAERGLECPTILHSMVMLKMFGDYSKRR